MSAKPLVLVDGSTYLYRAFHALPGVRFRADKIVLGPELYAAARANELVVKEGLPFREAYRRVAAKLTR